MLSAEEDGGPSEHNGVGTALVLWGKDGVMERLKTMAILALLAALAGSIALAATGGEAEVRISARQLEDGRVEFGLQQRVDGRWGERVLPRGRYFPADAAVNRWLNSTPMTMSVAGADDLAEGPQTSNSVEVRITARRLGDKRVEFALQQRMDGEWGDRILTRGRYFPPTARINRWLNSTPMTVSVVGTGGPAASITPQTLNIRTQVGQGFTPSGAVWDVRLDDFTDERLASVVSPTESSSSIYEPHLGFSCLENGTVLRAGFIGLPVSDINDRYTVTIRWDSLAAQTMTLSENVNRGHFLDNPTVYRRNVANHDMLRVRFVGYSTSVTATIDLSAIREAPTWPNILACGN